MKKQTMPTIASAIVALATLSACGGGSSSAPEAEPASPKARIAALEASGALPKLERTDTVDGLDTNADGIRDDVEAFISTHYSTPEQQAASRQFASVMQAAMLVDKEDIAAVKAISLRSSRAVNCIYTRFDPDGDIKPAAVVQELRSISTNTKQRLLAYLAYAKALDGTTSALPEGDTCE